MVQDEKSIEGLDKVIRSLIYAVKITMILLLHEVYVDTDVEITCLQEMRLVKVMTHDVGVVFVTDTDHMIMIVFIDLDSAMWNYE